MIFGSPELVKSAWRVLRASATVRVLASDDFSAQGSAIQQSRGKALRLPSTAANISA